MTSLQHTLRAARFSSLLFATLSFFISIAAAQVAGTGTIGGRVLNSSSGEYVGNASVSVEGSAQTTLTDANGEYLLAGVPAGEARVVARFAGLEPVGQSVLVVEGVRVARDFSLGATTLREPEGETVVLDKFTIVEREMTAQRKTLQAQKNAPNVMNVVEFDEFANMGDGDPSQMLKYVPGVAIFGDRSSISVRGLSQYSTLVTADGANVASAFGDRDVRLSDIPVGNLQRIEVTKVPTPDMPASAIGGSVNLVYKTGFSRSTPLLTYNVFGTTSTMDGFRGLDLSMKENTGRTRHTTASSLQPGVELSYIHPVNKKLAFTFNAKRASRFQEGDYPQIARNYVTGINTTTTVSSSDIYTIDSMASLGVDWKPAEKHLFQFNVQTQGRELFVSRARLILNYGAGATGGEDFTQGAVPGAGNALQSDTMDAGRNRTGLSGQVRYTYTGDTWKIAGSASYARNHRTVEDVSGGTFATVVLSNIPQLVIRADDFDHIGNRRTPTFTVVNRSGVTVDPFRLTTNTINSVTSNESTNVDVRDGGKLDFTRSFNTTIPVSMKFGGQVDRQRNDRNATGQSWTFTPPGGAAGRIISNFDVLARDYAARKVYTDSSGRQFTVDTVDTSKVYDLYREHPEYFILDQNAAYIAAVNGSRYLQETISAAFVRADVKLLDKRLWLVGGVRYERTDDEGQGPLVDTRAATVQTQYTERGFLADRNYDGFYPSLNSTYAITDNLLVRAAYARTIGRPRLSDILPGTTITRADIADPLITIVNTGLIAQTADSYDLSLELYELKGASISVGAFRKDIVNFVSDTREDATLERLRELGLSEEYVGYDIVSKANAGEAVVTGYEWSYRQTFPFLPGWARGFSVFVNATQLKVTGANADDFVSFAPRQINYGAGYANRKFLAKLNVANDRDGMRTSGLLAASNASQTAGSYTLQLPSRQVDLSLEYRFSKRFSAYCSVRNLLNDEIATTGRRGPGIPEYAEPLSIFTTGGADVTFGLKGEF
ncbi:TonB-dependent receptor domain-containing protein [Oleiharenicola lentus]|uniref:TonB-dependent receptor domain-containing protein n=1 Tax=Oleiharenicola lentus TaxID=2508720 RepID=UPI003F67016E